jgi:hypothetical protein
VAWVGERKAAVQILNHTPSTYAVVSWVFLRLLGIVYVFAFLSLATQIVGLAGHDGISPAALFMDSARAALSTNGLDRFRLLPTLTWIGASDGTLRALCWGGVGLAALLTAGVLPMVTLPLLWLFYLSLSIASREFLSYQWDALLLEAGFLSIFLAPWTVFDRFRRASEPPRLAVWLLRWLVFRLLLGSGAVKLLSGDPTWRGLTALDFHFWTQPIPTPLAWYFSRLPTWCLTSLTAVALTIELGAPFLMLGPRRARALACVLFIGLQAGIALTGNYAFFNLLTASLCLLLLDDRMLARPGLEAAPDARPGPGQREIVSRLRKGLVSGVAVFIVPLSLFSFSSSLGIDLPATGLVASLTGWLEPFRSVNTYGLFAVMTTSRPQIVVEGSDDGAVWKAYELEYQPTDPHDALRWVAPHQPRLDWQMWFAALGRYESEHWFQNFCVRLLQGSPTVLKLLRSDPFDGRPPRYVRATLYRYRFADAATHARDGVWWTRELVGEYSPVLSLSQPARP